jgi:hypothetical protein
MNFRFRTASLAMGMATLLISSMIAASSPIARSQYYWLHFGPKATIRVLVQIDGKNLTLEYYDANGKPTGRKEQFDDQAKCEKIAIKDSVSQTTYVINSIQDGRVDVEIRGPVKYQQYGSLNLLSEDPNVAPILHFDGPLMIEAQKIKWELTPGMSLRKGDKPTELRAHVGTLDCKKHASVVVKTMFDNGSPAFPPEVRPTVEIEFPPQKPGDEPIKKVYALNTICCGCIFHGPILVPKEAGEGMAKVTFSFGPWKSGDVASSTIELPVETPAAAFLGEWQNTDQNSSKLTRLKIAKADKGWTIQAWDRSGKEDMDRGIISLSLFGDTIYSTIMRYGQAKWSDDGTDKQVSLRLEQGCLSVEEFTAFEDEQFGANYRARYEFKRQ